MSTCSSFMRFLSYCIFILKKIVLHFLFLQIITLDIIYANKNKNAMSEINIRHKYN